MMTVKHIHRLRLPAGARLNDRPITVMRVLVPQASGLPVTRYRVRHCAEVHCLTLREAMRHVRDIVTGCVV